MILVLFLAVRHLRCKNEASCGKMKCSGGDGSGSMHGGCIVRESRVSGETVAVECCDEVNSADRLFSAVPSDYITAPRSLISHHSSLSSCAPANQTCVIDTNNSERTSVNAASDDGQLTVSDSPAPHISSLPCDRLSTVRLSEENSINSASNKVSLSVTQTRKRPLLDDCCAVDISNHLDSCVKESSSVRKLPSLQIDGISALSLTTDVRNPDSVVHSKRLAEAGKSLLEVNSSDSVLDKHFTPVHVDSSATPVCCLPGCVSTNATLAKDSSQNGLTAVEQIVSCFKSLTAIAKSEKSAHDKGQLHVLDMFCVLYITIELE